MKFKDTKYGDLTGKTYNGDIYVNNTNLDSLEGAPDIVKGNFCLYHNKLTTLEGAPKSVGDNFWCSDNNLTTLEGSPNNVNGFFRCIGNKLTSLEGAPKKIGGNFDCSRNKNLTQNEIYKLLDSDINGTIQVPKGLTAPTEDDYKLYKKLGMRKFIKIKNLKAKLK